MSSMFEQDYIRRIIKQIAQFVQRVLDLKREGRYDEALEAVQGAYASLLGPDRLYLKQLDPGTVAALLGDGELVRTFARLHREEGELAALKCDLERAVANYARARDLYVEAQAMLGGEDPECRAGLAFVLMQLEDTAVGFPA